MIPKLRNKTYRFLRWTEKWTKTDMIYLTKGGFWLTLGQIVSSLSTILLSIAFANLIPKEIYGNYKYILSIVSVLSIFTLGEIGTSLNRSIAMGYKGSLLYPMKTQMKWGLIGGLISIFVAIFYFINGNSTLTIAFLVCAVFLPIMDPLSISSSFLSGKKLFKKYTKYNIFTRIGSTAILITTIFFTQNVILIVFAYFISNTLIRASVLYIITKKYHFSRAKDKSIISYGKHLTAMSIIGTIAGQLDKIITYHYLGAIELAIYSFAIAIPEQIKGIFKNVTTLAFPKFSAQQNKTIDKNFIQKLQRYILLTLIIFVVYVFAAPLIYKILFPQYTEAILYSQVFSLSILTFPAGLLVAMLQSKGEKKKLYQLNTITPLIQILLLLIFLKMFGLMGVIIARVLTKFTIFFFATYFNIKK